MKLHNVRQTAGAFAVTAAAVGLVLTGCGKTTGPAAAGPASAATTSGATTAAAGSTASAHINICGEIRTQPMRHINPNNSGAGGTGAGTPKVKTNAASCLSTRGMSSTVKA